jgi:hypothetical protein
VRAYNIASKLPKSSKHKRVSHTPHDSRMALTRHAHDAETVSVLSDVSQSGTMCVCVGVIGFEPGCVKVNQFEAE